jgi:hypothetical protein
LKHRVLQEKYHKDPEEFEPPFAPQLNPNSLKMHAQKNPSQTFLERELVWEQLRQGKKRILEAEQKKRDEAFPFKPVTLERPGAQG